MNRKFKTICSFFVASMLCIPCTSTAIKAEENYNVKMEEIEETEETEEMEEMEEIEEIEEIEENYNVNDNVYSTYSNNLLGAVKATETKKCEFQLAYPNAIQNFDFGSTTSEIYVTQNDKNNTTYLSRCKIKNKVATVQDEIKMLRLEGYGHGESLEVIPKSSGKADIWLGSGYNSIDGDVNWSRTISRITYNKGNIENELIVDGFKKAILKMTGISETEKNQIKNSHRFRINVAVDDSSKKVGFRVVLKDNYGNISAPYYLIYKSSLFTGKTGNFNLENETPYAFFKVGNSANADCGYSSFQGFDLGTISGKNYLFTYSGAKGQNPKIKKYLYNKTSKVPQSMSEYTITSTTNEAEGIKIIGTSIYVGFNSRPGSTSTTSPYVHDGVYKLKTTASKFN